MSAVSPVVQTSKISTCQKKFFSFPVAVNNSVKAGLLVFLLQMFVITENIMKRPVLFTGKKLRTSCAEYVPCMGRGGVRTGIWWGNVKERGHLDYLRGDEGKM
jgi:hypothetical protein